MSAPCPLAARKKLRPMRPKPLIPTRMVICLALSVVDRRPEASTGTLERAGRPTVRWRREQRRRHPSAAAEQPGGPAASLAGSWARPCGPHERRPPRSRVGARPAARASRWTSTTSGSTPWRRSAVDVVRHVVAAGLLGLGPQVADVDQRARRLLERVPDVGDRGGRQHARVERARAQHHLVGLRQCRHRLGRAGRVGRVDPSRWTIGPACPRSPPGRAPRRPSRGVGPEHDRLRRRRQHPADRRVEADRRDSSSSRRHEVAHRTRPGPPSSRLPSAWPASVAGPEPVLHGRGERAARLRPASATRHLRRSPGAGRPSGSRSRPVEPPSSATATTAVIRPA